MESYWQKTSFELCFKTYVTATKIVYFAQFGIFSYIGGSRQLQINSFIDLLFSVDKL